MLLRLDFLHLFTGDKQFSEAKVLHRELQYCIGSYCKIFSSDQEQFDSQPVVPVNVGVSKKLTVLHQFLMSS